MEPKNSLIPFAKIDEETVKRLVRGFALGETMEDMEAATNLHPKTIKSVILALRPRLFGDAFKHWTVEDKNSLAFNFPNSQEIEAQTYTIPAKCFYNRSCYSNYEQGRRKKRVCRTCPLWAWYTKKEAKTLDGAIQYLDLVHSFYHTVLNVGQERELKPLTVFRLRYFHVSAVASAWEQSRRIEDGTIADFNDTSFGSARAFYETLLRDLEREPLQRWPRRPLDEWDAKYGDLDWTGEESEGNQQG